MHRCAFDDEIWGPAPKHVSGWVIESVTFISESFVLQTIKLCTPFIGYATDNDILSGIYP